MHTVTGHRAFLGEDALRSPCQGSVVERLDFMVGLILVGDGSVKSASFA